MSQNDDAGDQDNNTTVEENATKAQDAVSRPVGAHRAQLVPIKVLETTSAAKSPTAGP